MTVDPDDLLLTRDASALGRDARSLSRGVAVSELRRVRRGVQIEASAWEALRARDRFLLRVHALVATSSRDLVLSHWAAAALHGLPTPVTESTRIDVTVPAASNRALVGVRAHTFPLAGEDVETIDGLLTTTWARTVVDIAASVAFREAVVVADAALHRFPPSRRDAARAELEAAWGRAQPRRAARKVREALDFADGGSGSVGESQSRVSLRVIGLPIPVLQKRFFDARGFIGDTDFWFPDYGVIGETDGYVKYSDPEMTKGDPGRVVYDEKVREDRLRAKPEVHGFARWDYHVACTPRLLGLRLAAAGVPLPPRRGSGHK